MKKILHPFDQRTYGGRHHPVFIKVEIKAGVLSITGVVGPTIYGNCFGGAGQICMDYAHRNPQDDDKRSSQPIKPSELRFAPNWNAKKWLDLLDIWERWHMNDTHAECEHQRALGWRYDDHHNPETFKGEPCPTCGYEIGSAWKREELPQDVINFLASLPDTDRQPAWV
jgi:hypothetical protein